MSRTRNVLLGLLAASTVGGAWLAWRQHHELTELRAAALQRSERADLQKRLWDLERRNRSLQDQLAAPERNAAEATRPAADARGPRPAGGSRPEAALAQAAALRATLAKPEVQALVTVQQRAAIESRYAALFRALALGPEQTEKLKALLLDRANTRQDVLAAALEQGIDPRTNPAAIQQLVADAQAGTDRALRDLLGEAGTARLRTYEQTEPQRLIVAELQQRLSYTPTPLSAEQAERLVGVLAAQPAPSAPAPGSAASAAPAPAVRPNDLGTTLATAVAGTAAGALLGMAETARAAAPITSAAVAEAQTVLSPPQVAALQQLQQQQQAQQQLQQVIRESMPGGMLPRPSPPR